mmetsp:Transcript_5787/g.17086  ORF Transcript_5787/g.17086 Transcript_5787/m.17086 type:complete len:247 (-) Transcript_5787:538-1278(-)
MSPPSLRCARPSRHSRRCACRILTRPARRSSWRDQTRVTVCASALKFSGLSGGNFISRLYGSTSGATSGTSAPRTLRLLSVGWPPLRRGVRKIGFRDKMVTDAASLAASSQTSAPLAWPKPTTTTWLLAKTPGEWLPSLLLWKARVPPPRPRREPTSGAPQASGLRGTMQLTPVSTGASTGVGGTTASWSCPLQMHTRSKVRQRPPTCTVKPLGVREMRSTRTPSSARLASPKCSMYASTWAVIAV